MKKYILILLCSMLLVVLTGCKTEQSLSFKVEDGSSIKVTLETTNNYKLNYENEILSIENKKEVILEGEFLTEDLYRKYESKIYAKEDMKLIEAKPKEKPTFYFYQYEGEKFKEIGYLFKIEGTNMGVFLTSISPMKDVKEAFSRLEFEKIE